MTDLDWLISVDDHLIEPPDLWLARAPARYRERVPQTRVVDGAEHWYFDGGVPYGFVGKYIACAGLKPEEFSPEPAAYSWMRPGYSNSAARIEDMDADGVLASACFPSVIGICGQKFFEAKDKDLALFCITTYNDWVIEEWAGGAPGRFIPLVLLPLWDPRRSATEIERCAKKGAKGISFTENPYQLGLPSLHDDSGYWDPVFAAVNETKLPLCIHFGSTSKVITSSPDAPQLVPASLVPINLATAMVDWIWSGLLARYPNIKLVLAEGGIGWIPYMLERLKHLHVTYKWAKDNDWRTNLMTGEVTKREKGLDLDTPPVEVFKRHVFGCFIDDEIGMTHLDLIQDNVMIETDYPHSDGTWPRSIQNAGRRLAGKSDEVKLKALRGNALRVFDFDPAPIPTKKPAPYLCGGAGWKPR